MSIKNNISSLQEVLNTINTLPEAGTDLPELSNEGSASDLLSGKQLIDGDGNVVTGNIPTKTSSNLTASGATVTVPAGYYASQATKSVATATQATPSVSINSSGLITASATQTAGYVSAGTKSGTKQLTTQAAKTITPTKSSQTAVASGVYTTGAVTVAAIPSQYVDNSTVDAVESDVMSGKKFGANGSVKTGTFTIDSELSTQDDLIAQIQTALQNKATPSGGVILPTLTNPATAENLENGYELIDGNGNVVVGTHVCSSGSGSVNGDCANDMFVIRYDNACGGVTSLILPFKSGTTWEEYCDSYLCGYISCDDYLEDVQQLILYDDYGNVYYSYVNTNEATAYISRLVIEGVSCTDIIQSFNDGHYYYAW